MALGAGPMSWYIAVSGMSSSLLLSGKKLSSEALICTTGRPTGSAGLVRVKEAT